MRIVIMDSLINASVPNPELHRGDQQPKFRQECRSSCTANDLEMIIPGG
jgi:hypothetical protein